MTEIRSTDYFAIIPEWIIYEDVTSNAVRLYAVLNRFANSRGHAWPSRKTIADLMRVSVATIDRAKEELVNIGALTIEARTTPSGDPSSNLYILHTSFIGKHPPLSPVTRGTFTREETGTSTRDEQKRASMKQSQTSQSSRARTCPVCIGKYRAGHDDGTEGRSHIYNKETQEFTVCPHCDGVGTEPAR